MTNGSQKKLALVLSGGGARGAYEAGIIHYIRTQLPKHISQKRPFDIVCGSSVGAINTCFMAATSHNLEYQGKMAHEFWSKLEQERIYKRGVGSLTRFTWRTLSSIFSQIFGSKTIDDNSKKLKKYHFKGLLDTSPFPFFLKDIIPWKQITLNIQRGLTSAISVTGTNAHTGKMELFIEKHPSVSYTGRHRAHFVTIEARHAMASAAIPILFPTVRVGRNYYCDGGLRLNTPLSPAIQLGADKMLVIGLHHVTERAEQGVDEPFTESILPPTLGEVIGKVLNSIFLDKLDYDLEQMERINKIIEWGEHAYGSEFLGKINEYLSQRSKENNQPIRKFRRLEVMTIFPSVDIRKIFAECVVEPRFLKKSLTAFERTMMKLLDLDIRHANDFLSFILFVPQYLNKMLDLGFEDAKLHHDELVGFFEG